jgi:hypothetical protein
MTPLPLPTQEGSGVDARTHTHTHTHTTHKTLQTVYAKKGVGASTHVVLVRVVEDRGVVRVRHRGVALGEVLRGHGPSHVEGGWGWGWGGGWGGKEVLV